MPRINVTVFVSYARANKRLKSTFMDKLEQQTSAAKYFRYKFWVDDDIAVGERWDQEIKKAIDDSDLGLLLVSPAFLGSQYIPSEELRRLLRKRVIPVLLQPVDMENQDLKGLEEHQIFRLEKGVQAPRAFGELRDPKRDVFAQALFVKMQTRLKLIFRNYADDC